MVLQDAQSETKLQIMNAEAAKLEFTIYALTLKTECSTIQVREYHVLQWDVQE